MIDDRKKKKKGEERTWKIKYVHKQKENAEKEKILEETLITVVFKKAGKKISGMSGWLSYGNEDRLFSH